ncbi:MAG: hypothetical protein HXS46_15395 [Theionarchaea archaeon]|nr:hypothetical protein [Theionarchaea archaeon]
MTISLNIIFSHNAGGDCSLQKANPMNAGIARVAGIIEGQFFDSLNHQ